MIDTRLAARTGRSKTIVRFFSGVGLAVAIIVVGLMVAAFAPRFLGYSSFVILGGSMEPAIHKGSVAVAKPVDAASIGEGDIIAYRTAQAGIPTTHRVILVEEIDGLRTLTTKGDANSAADPTKLAATGRGSRIVYSVPYIGYLVHPPLSASMQKLLIVGAVAGLAAMLLWEVWKPAKGAQPVSRPAASTTTEA